jgi:hypothetical protein
MTMFRALRKRIHVSPATAIATLALVFAMTGGAYAAKHYLITSTKQISPKVLKALKGVNGTNGAAGLAGAAGAQGPAGPAGAGGAKGESGAPGASGAKGENGTPGTTGATGPPGPFTKTLPSKATETGSWFAKSSAGATPGVLFVISFPIRLASPLLSENTHVVTKKQVAEGKIPAGCSGTAEEPEASAGTLCVFEGGEGGGLSGGSNFILQPGSESTAGAGTTGAVVIHGAAAAEEPYWGTWAVTAE